MAAVPSRVIGIDCGGVIMATTGRGCGNEDTVFGDNYLSSPVNPGAFEVIKDIVDLYGADNVYIVSKCGTKVEGRTREWLDHNGFFDRTGFSRENLRFCKERPDKAPICAELGITTFIDDNQGVLSHMHGSTVTELLLFHTTALKAGVDKKYMPMEGWQAVRSFLIEGKAPVASKVSVQVCKYFEAGKCRKGEECRNVHPSQAEVCKYFMDGRCRKGEHCRNLHPSEGSGDACKYFLAGTCRKGNQCRHPHPTQP